MAQAKKPILYVGGGVINSGEEACRQLMAFADKTRFPITQTLMALGAFPTDHRQSLGMLGMHGTYEANMAMHQCDVMVAIGARFDDRITGRLDAFSPHSKKIHIDIDASSINKCVRVDIPIIADAAKALHKMNLCWQNQNITPQDCHQWWQQIDTVAQQKMPEL